MASNNYQKDRIYSLIVGQGEDAIEINNLQIKFEVTKTSNNSQTKNKAKVEIYNLPEEWRKKLESRYITVELRAAYANLIGKGDPIPILFSGQTVDCKIYNTGEVLSNRQGTDIVTSLTIDTLFTNLNSIMISKIVPAGSTIKQAFRAVAAELIDVSRQEIGGRRINDTLPNGMPLSGTPRQCLDQLCAAHMLEWQIDNQVLYVSDVGGTFTESKEGVPKIGEMSGLIESPRFKTGEKGNLKLTGFSGIDPNKEFKSKEEKELIQSNITLSCKILMNPSIVAGSIIYLDYGELVGYYKVNEVRHVGDFFGRDWYSELTLSSK